MQCQRHDAAAENLQSSYGRSSVPQCLWMDMLSHNPGPVWTTYRHNYNISKYSEAQRSCFTDGINHAQYHITDPTNYPWFMFEVWTASSARYPGTQNIQQYFYPCSDHLFHRYHAQYHITDSTNYPWSMFEVWTATSARYSGTQNTQLYCYSCSDRWTSVLFNITASPQCRSNIKDLNNLCCIAPIFTRKKFKIYISSAAGKYVINKLDSS